MSEKMDIKAALARVVKQLDLTTEEMDRLTVITHLLQF